MKHIKIRTLQDLFDEITAKQGDEIKKHTDLGEQHGFLSALLFIKHLIINRELEIMNSEE